MPIQNGYLPDANEVIRILSLLTKNLSQSILYTNFIGSSTLCNQDYSNLIFGQAIVNIGGDPVSNLYFNTSGNATSLLGNNNCYIMPNLRTYPPGSTTDYDDFSTALDSTKWTVEGTTGSVYTNGGYLVIKGTGNAIVSSGNLINENTYLYFKGGTGSIGNLSTYYFYLVNTLGSVQVGLITNGTYSYGNMSNSMLCLAKNKSIFFNSGAQIQVNGTGSYIITDISKIYQSNGDYKIKIQSDTEQAKIIMFDGIGSQSFITQPFNAFLYTNIVNTSGESVSNGIFTSNICSNNLTSQISFDSGLNYTNVNNGSFFNITSNTGSMARHKFLSTGSGGAIIYNYSTLYNIY